MLVHESLKQTILSLRAHGWVKFEYDLIYFVCIICLYYWGYSYIFYDLNAIVNKLFYSLRRFVSQSRMRADKP